MGMLYFFLISDPCKYCIEPLHTQWREEAGQGPVTKKRSLVKPLQPIRMEQWRIRNLLRKQLGQILSRVKIQNTENKRRKLHQLFHRRTIRKSLRHPSWSQ